MELLTETRSLTVLIPTEDALGRGGSLARVGLPAALGSATYDAANRIVTRGGVTFAHDANGNLTSDGTTT